MATGDDLSTIGRKPKNEDMLDEGVWIRHPETGVTHLVTHKAHVKRLLDVGGVRVASPDGETPVATTLEGESVTELKAELERLRALLEERHGSTRDDDTIDIPRATPDRRPGGNKSAVR